MFGMFFGQFLLREGIVKRKVLLDALEKSEKSLPSLDTLAIHEGMMKASQVARIKRQQSYKDESFGELAIEMGYLTSKQLKILYQRQKSESISLAQVLIEEGILTTESYEKLLERFKKSYDLNDEALEAFVEGNPKTIIEKMLPEDMGGLSEIYLSHILLFLRNLQRFVSEHFQVLPIRMVTVTEFDHLVRQSILYSPKIFSGIGGDAHVMQAMAEQYAGESFDGFDQDAIDSVGEFLNMQNGLFVVNKSDEGISMGLDLQSHIDYAILRPYRPLFEIPIKMRVGTIYLLLGLL